SGRAQAAMSGFQDAPRSSAVTGAIDARYSGAGAGSEVDDGAAVVGGASVAGVIATVVGVVLEEGVGAAAVVVDDPASSAPGAVSAQAAARPRSAAATVRARSRGRGSWTTSRTETVSHRGAAAAPRRRSGGVVGDERGGLAGHAEQGAVLRPEASRAVAEAAVGEVGVEVHEQPLGGPERAHAQGVVEAPPAPEAAERVHDRRRHPVAEEPEERRGERALRHPGPEQVALLVRVLGRRVAHLGSLEEATGAGLGGAEREGQRPRLAGGGRAGPGHGRGQGRLRGALLRERGGAERVEDQLAAGPGLDP